MHIKDDGLRGCGTQIRMKLATFVFLAGTTVAVQDSVNKAEQTQGAQEAEQANYLGYGARFGSYGMGYGMGCGGGGFYADYPMYGGMLYPRMRHPRFFM